MATMRNQKFVTVWSCFIFLSLFVLSGCSNPLQQNHAKNIDSVSFVHDKNILPAVVLGGGIGGLTAAIYLTQANIPTLVVEGQKPGGTLTQSHAVHNWPGEFGTPGMSIVEKIKKHALASGAIIVQEKVVAVNFQEYPYTIELASLTDQRKRTIKTLTCIIAMGTEPNFLNIPGEHGDHGYWGKGVGNCAVCDGALYKNKKVIVVGGGDAAIEEASYLAPLVQSLTIAVRKDNFRARDLKAKEQILSKPNVTVLFNTEIKEIKGDGSQVTNVILYNNKNQHEATLPVDGVFLAIGSHPNSTIFKGQLDLDDQGFIVLKNYQETSKPGVFAAGDIANRTFVQAITAADNGHRSAVQAKKYLDSLGYESSNDHEKNDKPATSNNITPEEADKETHAVTEITNEQMFEKIVLKATTPVILDVFATWCIPCQHMAPIFEKLAEEYAEKIVFAKLNITNKSINLENLIKKIHGKSVYSAPTFILIKQNKEVLRFEGERTLEVFKKIIDRTFGDTRNYAFIQ